MRKIGLKKKIRPVNRLDKDTTGIVIFAKNEYVQENLVRQMATGEFEKEYVADISAPPIFIVDSVSPPVFKSK